MIRYISFNFIVIVGQSRNSLFYLILLLLLLDKSYSYQINKSNMQSIRQLVNHNCILFPLRNAWETKK